MVKRSDSAQSKARLGLQRRYDMGRMTLVLLLAVTLVNQLLLHKGVAYHFFLSAAVPYYLLWVCEKLRVSPALWSLAATVAAVLYAGYGWCWWRSRRQRRWLTAALGLYGVDTLLLVIFSATLLKNTASCLLEIMTHGLIFGCLIMADRAGGRLSRYAAAKCTAAKQKAHRSGAGTFLNERYSG